MRIRGGKVGRGGRTAKLTGWRRWAFPLAAATLLPALLLVALELGLRAVGKGYPTSFFLPVPSRAAWTTNPQFGWRFFPRQIARTPIVADLPRKKAGDAYRVFVLGGSAALGTPEPAYGFSRLLEVMLRARYPGIRFEVVNAAMTAANSHLALPIARECAARDPDAFLVYMGNNEVVGPFGPGTVFAPFSPSLTALRLSVALKATRVGQLAMAAAARLAGGRGLAEWRGMEMFVNREVSADDPRLEAVYAHYRANLEDIAAVARRAGAPLLLATVATNLAESPPFASRHRPGLTDPDRKRFDAAFQRGVEAASGGRQAEAVDAFDRAAAVDDLYAELRYRRGRAELALGRGAAARADLVAARDLDALRFRADSRLNRIVREIAAELGGRGVILVDAEKALATAPEDRHGLAGDGLFWEHVHLRFAGNYRLARAFLERLEPLLPERVRSHRAAGVAIPDSSTCARRLAVTPWDRRRVAADVRALTDRPPFTAQAGHSERRAALSAEIHDLTAAARNDPAGQETLYREALAARPDDLPLREGYAGFLAGHHRPADAAAQWRELLARVPGVAAWLTHLGVALEDAAEADPGARDRLLRQAEDALTRALQRLPGLAAGHANLGSALEARGDLDGAEREYRRALALHPGFTIARIDLGELAERRGRPAAAETLYREAVRLDPRSAEAHLRLGTRLSASGHLDAAIAEYRRALALDADDTKAHNNLGFALDAQGRAAAAEAEYRAALGIDPDNALAHFNLGDNLLARGRADEAAASYRAGLALAPDNLQARYNLAQALASRGREAEAAAELRALLARRPGDVGALHNLAWILATTRRPDLADPAEAVRLAEAAVAATGGGSAEVLETLAVAYAADGRRAEAVTAAERALVVARASGDRARIATLEARLRELRRGSGSGR